jgi:hypothetical protein
MTAPPIESISASPVSKSSNPNSAWMIQSSAAVKSACAMESNFSEATAVIREQTKNTISVDPSCSWKVKHFSHLPHVHLKSNHRRSSVIGVDLG